jgi:uncharacterized YccA/Bax inhibitor family protein
MTNDDQPMPDLTPQSIPGGYQGTPQGSPTGQGQGGRGTRGRRPRQAGNWATRRNFSRMEQVFGTGAAGHAGAGAGAGAGAEVGAVAVQTRPAGLGGPPVSDVKPLVETDVLSKVFQLTVMAMVAGGISFLFPVSLGFALVAVLVAFGIGLWATFSPRRARVLAPIYAVVEGLALGVISRLYNAQSHGIVPAAIILTAAVFLGVLISYRTGLVRIGNRFLSITVVATFALLAVMLASLLGLRFPGIGNSASELIIFGVLYVVVGIMNLYVDFEMIRRAARAGVPAEAEWYAAFSVFLAVVMLYLGLLRILAGSRR